MKVIILAGGSGKRLWPLSNQELPKQFLKFFDHESLFQKTCKRFEDFEIVDEIFLVVNEKYETIAKEQIKDVQLKKKIEFIIEPEQKNTAGAILFSLKYLKEKTKIDENTKILILPSDHLIFPNKRFLEYLENANKLDLKGIVTFGIRPNKIETGYGHIKLGKKTEDNVYQVEKFIEKPNFEKAKKLFISENYLWNAGIFLLTEKIFKKEIKKYCPEIYDYYALTYKKLLRHFYRMPNISIDYALMEKTKNILVSVLDLSWSDVGSWDSIYDVMEKDENLNVTKGNVLTLDTKNSLIFGRKKLISTIGLENILIVETEEAIFLAKKGESQKVKELIEKM